MVPVDIMQAYKKRKKTIDPSSYDAYELQQPEMQKNSEVVSLITREFMLLGEELTTTILLNPNYILNISPYTYG